jgi:hypothetical protein
MGKSYCHPFSKSKPTCLDLAISERMLWRAQNGDPSPFRLPQHLADACKTLLGELGPLHASSQDAWKAMEERGREGWDFEDSNRQTIEYLFHLRSVVWGLNGLSRSREMGN